MFRIIYHSLIIFLFCLSSIWAEERTFHLTTGEIIKGSVLEENNQYFRLKIPYGEIKLEKKMIWKKKVIKDQTAKGKKTEINEKRINSEPESIIKKEIKVSDYKADSADEKQLLNWIMERKSEKTGLFESFFPSSNPMLKNQASTYDQGVIGIVLLKLGYTKEATAIGDFFLSLTEKRGGFCNFYHRNSGYPGLEKTAHLGPNSWIGLLFLHLYKKTNNIKYLSGAKEVIDWSIKLNQLENGFVMAERATSRAPWNKIVSTENNIDLYALLREYLKLKNIDKNTKKYQQQLKKVESFLLKKMIKRKKNGYQIFRGYRKKGAEDKIEALDTYTWLLAAFGAQYLEEKGFDTKLMVQSFLNKFSVEDSGIKGFDFTDRNERKVISRDPMVSFEWTFGAILAMREVEKIHGENWNEENNSFIFINEMNKAIFHVKPDFKALPYASRGNELIFKDSHWWKTPANGSYGNQCGALISTAWFFLIRSGINPFWI